MIRQDTHNGRLPTLREVMVEGEVIDFPTPQPDQSSDVSGHNVLAVINDIRQRAHDIAMELHVMVVDNPEHGQALAPVSRQAREFLLAVDVLREELEERVFLET